MAVFLLAWSLTRKGSREAVGPHFPQGRFLSPPLRHNLLPPTQLGHYHHKWHRPCGRMTAPPSRIHMSYQDLDGWRVFPIYPKQKQTKTRPTVRPGHPDLVDACREHQNMILF